MSINDRYSARRLAEEVAPLTRKLLGSVRRLAVELTNNVRWVMVGHDRVSEKFSAEVFQGIGIFARPPEGEGEAVVVFLGGPRHGVAIAVRDERTRAAVLQALGGGGADETIVHNSQAALHIRGDQIEAKAVGGTAVALATKADLDATNQALDDTINLLLSHVHTGVTTGGGSSSTMPPVSPPAAPTAIGTSKLKGQ